MGNQHPSTLEERIYKLGINAKFGDGYLWKHPETKNYKVIYSSTTPELLEEKRKVCPEIFTTGVVKASVGKGNGRYKNAKQLYRLASIVQPIFTELASKDKAELLKELTLQDLALWYLDDGCVIKRTDGNSFRYFLCIGDTCNTEEKTGIFLQRMREVFNKEKVGSIRLNNSKATENNKNWVIPKDIAKIILDEAITYGVLPRKFPSLW